MSESGRVDRYRELRMRLVILRNGEEDTLAKMDHVWLMMSPDEIEQVDGDFTGTRNVMAGPHRRGE